MDEQTPTPDPILVTGGTGKTGRRVAARLTARGLPVRVGSRAATPPFDWAEPSTWEPAVRGVGSAYLNYYPGFGFPGAVAVVTEFCAVAVEAGVRRLVLLSGRGEAESQAAERAVRDSGAQWTVVRASWFNQNFTEDFLLDAVLAGEIALPAGDVVEAFVDVDDIADVAVAALTEDRHAREVYELSGPRLLGFHDVAAEIAKATGRAVRYVPLSTGQYAATQREMGLPADFVELFGKVVMTLDGRNASLTDGVQRALGRAPKDFSDFASEAAESGAWT
ncbi:NmrA family NAD(P)-binding protein [Actinokineospora sp.]|uniref:NmrA family NAD(P)-binding protein n=1 Tax=Actinokineospora sp. TaxID=1872133 RepID=UPI004038319B